MAVEIKTAVLPDYPKRTALIFLIFILAASFWVRFYRLADYGLFDSDAICYSTAIQQWNHGDYTNHWAKPGYQFLGFLTLKLIGFYDYLLFYLNSFFDLINIGLIFIIGRKLGIRNFLCLSASVLYSFVPYVLYEGMRGTPYLSSSTFLLLTFLSLLCYLKSVKYQNIFIFLIGLFSAYAGSMHPSLLCLPLFFGSIILFFYLKKPLFSKENLFRRIPFGIFVFPYFMVYLGLAIFMSGENIFKVPSVILKMGKVLYIHYVESTQGSQGGVFDKLWYTLVNLDALISWPILVFVCGILALVLIPNLVAVLRKKNVLLQKLTRYRLKYLSLIWGVVVYFLLINFLVVKGWTYMLAIPLIPFVIIGTMYLVNIYAEKARFKYLDIIIFCATLSISSYNLTANAELIKKTPTVYRQLADALCGKVNSNNRLLTMPSQLYFYKIEAVYFSGDNIYRVKAPWKPRLKELLQYKIKYIMVAKELNRNAKELNRVYPRTPEDFAQLESEYRLIYSGLNAIGAKKLYESNKLSVYEIPAVADRDIAGFTGIVTQDTPFYNETAEHEVVSMNCQHKG